MLLVWANTPEPSSATKTPKRQRTEAIKTRRLKKADFEVDFFFIDGTELFSLGGEPDRVVRMLGEMMDACQHFFWNFLIRSRIMLSESGLRGDETALIGGSRIFGVRCVFASLFGEARFCIAPEINPGA